MALVGSTVWGGLSSLTGGTESWAGRMGFVYDLTPLPVLSLFFMLTVEDVVSQHPAPAALSAVCCHDALLSLWNLKVK